MNINTLNSTEVEHKSNEVPFALYKNCITQGYHARVINQGTCGTEDLVCDIITAGLNNGHSKEELLAIATLLNNAKTARILTGCTVDDGFSKTSLKISGMFKSKNESFSNERHTLSVSCSGSAILKGLVKNITPVIRQGNSIEPEITEIFDLETKGCEKLTKNGFLDIKGTNIAIAGENEDIGLYFVNTENNENTIKLSVEKLGRNQPKHISCVVPANIENGTYKLMIKTQYVSGRTFSRETKTNTFEKEFQIS